MPSCVNAPDATGHNVGDGMPWGPKRSHSNREMATTRALVLLAAAVCITTPTVADAPPCSGDFNGCGAVTIVDLPELLAAWGPCPGCRQDLSGDDEVGFQDLLIILSQWGPCP